MNKLKLRTQTKEPRKWKETEVKIIQFELLAI